MMYHNVYPYTQLPGWVQHMLSTKNLRFKWFSLIPSYSKSKPKDIKETTTAYLV